MEVAHSGDYKRILISGDATDEQCQEQWEKIIHQHNYHNGNHQYLNYINHLKSYRDLWRKAITIKASLTYLLGAIDDPIIQWLATQGYKLDQSSQGNFEKSLALALQRADNFNSKLAMKLNQIQNFNQQLMTARKQFNEHNEGTGLEERLAELSFYLGFSVDENVTLARYNEYVKIINKQQQNGNRTQRHNQ